MKHEVIAASATYVETEPVNGWRVRKLGDCGDFACACGLQVMGLLTDVRSLMNIHLKGG